MAMLVMGLADTLLAPAPIISLIHREVAATLYFDTLIFCAKWHCNPRPSEGAIAAPNPRMGTSGVHVSGETFFRDLWAQP